MRIELGEVEHHLRSKEGVREAVVVGRPTQDGEKRMVAYVVLDEALGGALTSATLAELRRHMADQLPDYMVPAAYVASRPCPSITT
jgi:acyl-coenzyme A synthetase/AMP-(fatty) acid ligase